MNDYSKKDFYGLLGLTYDATVEEIKKAYRKATVKYHPDVNKDGEKIFMQIKEAYEVLTDKNLRKNYDFIKGYDVKRHQKQKDNAERAKNAYTKYNYEQTDRKQQKYYKRDFSNEYKKNNSQEESTESQNKTFEKNETQDKIFQKTFSDIVSNLFTGKNKRNVNSEDNKPLDGSDITMPIEISYKEAINGTNRKINVLHTEICPVCGGKKFVNAANCKYCKGIGEISLHKKLNVKIPPHTENNKKIRLQGEGTKGLKGGKNGNLYLIVRITDDSYFKFDGNNVFSEVEILPYEAALGGEKEIKTLSGTVKLKIPAGTSSGQKFRLANEGLFDENRKIKGDQIVTIKIKVNDNLSEREKQLYEELKNISKGK